ncbi:MAG: hypothetical protein ABI178_07405 [Rhodanobacter sp.]
MSRFHFLRSAAALGVSLGMAAASLSLPVFADTPVPVTFEANSVWAQEIGHVSRSDSSHEYTVSIAAGKTLQVNLLTRNPNVYFKVKDQDHDKRLVDSFKTGVSTWSTTNPTATTYTIHVYVVTDAIESGEDAKYALQIGQYGAEDMKPPTIEVTFQANKPWVQEEGSLASGATAHNFSVSIAAGKTVAVNLVTSNPQLHFKVDDQTHDKNLVDTSKTGQTTWSSPVETATTYLIQVYVDPAAVSSGQKVPYALQVGQYGAGDAQPAQPAGASSAALPGATSMPPSAATTKPAGPSESPV